MLVLSILKDTKYFIIIPALFGNGESSSPSNHPTLKNFPKVSFYDNVRAQYELVTKHFGINHLYTVLGWSSRFSPYIRIPYRKVLDLYLIVGAGQTYQWITQYPDFMDLAVPFCGSAKTSLHNQVFLEGVKSAMLAAKGIRSAGPSQGAVATESEKPRTWTEEEKEVGMKAFGRGYAGW